MAVCNGLCILGKCPNRECVRYGSHCAETGRIDVGSRILEHIVHKDIDLVKSGFGFAVDIGTTTVVVYLVNMENGRCVSVKSALNSQIVLGTDVISRINYSSADEGLSALHDAIVNQLNSMFLESLNETGLAKRDVSEVVVTGNTTMLHLLEGLSPVSMGTVPFRPESLFGYEKSAESIGLGLPGASLYLVPCMSSFVGGDITSAVLASGLCENSKIALLMDLGTNGEIVLGNSDKIYTTSTAAGPAFEGAQIEKGMAGVNGAVCSVYAEAGNIVYDVIGNESPEGICGSGIIDLTSLLVSIGCIDETGYINNNNKYVRRDGETNTVYLHENVYLTQKDIRQVQTAKAAVAAGVKTVLCESGINKDDISAVYISGGFGNFMNRRSAAGIGLIDGCFSDKTECIGNGAGAGAIMALLNDSYKKECSRIAGISSHVELGGNQVFMNEFIECMTF